MDPYFWDDLTAALLMLTVAVALFAVLAPIADWLEDRSRK
jgi:hypothetical protein